MSRSVLVVCLVTAVLSAVATSLVWHGKMRREATRDPAIELKAEVGEEAGVQSSPPSPEFRPAPPSDNDEALSLQVTIREQTEQIRSLQEQLATLTRQAAPVVKKHRTPSKPRESYIDRLKREDPDRYEKVLERLNRKTEATERGLAESAAFLFNLDMAFMSEEQAANHRELLDLMAASWGLVDQLKAQPDSKEADDARAQIRRNVMAMQRAYKTERSAALEQWLRNLGYRNDEVQILRGEIEDVYFRTDPGNILPDTQFIGPNIMMSVETVEEGQNTRSITMHLDGALGMPETEEKR